MYKNVNSQTLRTIHMSDSSKMGKLECIHTRKYYTAIRKQITDIPTNKNEPHIHNIE